MTETTNMVEVFKNEKFGEIRTLNIEGEPWFVGKDITDVLSYTSPTRAMQDHDGFLGKSDKSLNQPTQRSVEMGLFDIKESVHVQQDESVLVVKTVKVTGKGQIYFLNKYLGANKALGRQAN